MKVEDVAKYFIYLASKKNVHLNRIKLQKLLYYAQGWSYIWDEKPLFEENIEAWKYGPVVPKIHHMYKKYEYSSIPSDEGLDCFEDARECELKTIEAVLDGYESYNPRQLIEKTIREDPWKNAINECKKSGNDIIRKSDIQEYFLRVYKH